MKIAAMTVFVLAIAASVQAQSPDNWATWEECQSATNFRWYVPATTSSLPLGTDERVVPLQKPQCALMDVPEALGDADPTLPGPQRWVKFEEGRDMIRNERTGDIVRLAKCRNRIYMLADATNPGLRQEQGVVVTPPPPAPSPLSPQATERIVREVVYRERDERREEKKSTPLLKNGWFWTGVGIGVGAVVCAVRDDHCGLGSQSQAVALIGGGGNGTTIIQK